jgi:hypothetical protein
MTINLFFSRYLPGIFTSIKVYSKNGITIVTCARYTLQCFVCTHICHGISWLNMKYRLKVIHSCVTSCQWYLHKHRNVLLFFHLNLKTVFCCKSQVHNQIRGHGISWLNMTNSTKYVELSCVLHVFCDNEIFLLFATSFRDFKWKHFPCYSAW